MATTENLHMSLRSGRYASAGAPVETDDAFLSQHAPTGSASPAPPRPGVFTSPPTKGAPQPTGAHVPGAPVESPRLSRAERLARANNQASPPKPASAAAAPAAQAPVADRPSAAERLARANPEAQPLTAPPKPTEAQPPVAARPSAAERLAEQSRLQNNTQQVRKEMATMKTLTRLLQAVSMRPGALASDEDRMAALSRLVGNAQALGEVVARIAGEDYQGRSYVRAMAMDASISLVCSAWEQNRDVQWDALLEATANTPEIYEAAHQVAAAVYRPVETVADAADRIGQSTHSAFWQVYGLGDTVNGITPRLAADVVRDCLAYLQGRQKFVLDNDLYVSWLQGSIRRMTDLVCADMRARFDGQEAGPSADDVQSILAATRSGFEGVENYAQNILEKPHANAGPRPADG